MNRLRSMLAAPVSGIILDRIVAISLTGLAIALSHGEDSARYAEMAYLAATAERQEDEGDPM